MRRKGTALLGVLLVLGTFVAACGGDDDDSDKSDKSDKTEELTTIKVGIIPIAALAPMYYGVEQKYFADEGLDVKLEIGQGGAAMTPSVVSGDLQFAFGNYISLMLARQNNVPVQVVSNIANGADSPDGGTDGLLVRANSGISSVKDLAGKTFAVPGLHGIEEVAIRTTLKKNGVDDSGIHFTEVPFPDMNAAVKSGQVDVAEQVEPFLTFGEQDGLVRLVNPIYEAEPSMPLGIVFASEDWLKDNPKIAKAFYRALQRSMEATSDKDLMRKEIVANTEIPADVVDKMALDNWQATIDRKALATVGQLATEAGVLDKEPNLDELIWDPN